MPPYCSDEPHAPHVCGKVVDVLDAVGCLGQRDQREVGHLVVRGIKDLMPIVERLAVDRTNAVSLLEEFAHMCPPINPPPPATSTVRLPPLTLIDDADHASRRSVSSPFECEVRTLLERPQPRRSIRTGG